MEIGLVTVLLFGSTSFAVAPDSCEPDDTVLTAKVLINGVAQSHDIQMAGNANGVPFTIGARGAGHLRIETYGAGYYNPVVWLYGPNNASVALAYHDGVADTTHGSSIPLPALGAGTYYIRVQKNLNDETIDSYSLQARYRQYRFVSEQHGTKGNRPWFRDRCGLNDRRFQGFANVTELTPHLHSGSVASNGML